MGSDNGASVSRIPETQFQQLVESARQGDKNAIGQLIQDCRGYLMFIANHELDSYFSPKLGASDLVQDAMLSAQRCMGGFEGQSRDELLAWIRGILINDIKETRQRFRTAKRDLTREQPLSDRSTGKHANQIPAGEATPATDAIAREEADRLKNVLEILSPEERKIIDLRNWQRLSFAEIGEQTGCSAEAARKRWSRAIIRLQSKLEPPP
jgi:RNA polymerase sigma-70 factor (ECF subfamily)